MSSSESAVTTAPVIFVLGPPGAGKGTQCARISKEYGFRHISAGDLLRAEVATGSDLGKDIDEIIKNGAIVPSEVTLRLLRAAMTSSSDATKGFLIDGFPRKLDQAIMFEEGICLPKRVLLFDCKEDDLVARLLKRGEQSGRSDDNVASIKKRFATFRDVSMACIDRYEQSGVIERIDASRPVEEVWLDVKKMFDALM